MKTAEASAEKDEPKDSTRTMEALAEESEETTCLRERPQRRRRRCVYGTRECTKMTVASAEEDGPEDSATMTEASVDDEE